MALKSGPAGCPLCGQGAGRGDQAVQEREGTNPVSCLRDSLEAAVPKGMEDGRAQSLTGRYWQSPGQAARLEESGGPGSGHDLQHTAGSYTHAEGR